MNENLTLELLDGRTLGYAEYGDSKGRPLFYFHGWPSSRFQGERFDDVAKKLRVRVISIDRPGYGLSTYYEGRTLLDFCDDVVFLADKLNIKKFSVVGVSGGGPFAAAMAYKIPNRLQKVGIVVGLAPTWVPGILSGMSFTGKIGWANYSKFPFLAHLGAKYHDLDAKYFSGLFSKFEFRAKVDQAVLKSLKDEAKRNKKEAFKQGSKGAEKDLVLYTKDWGFRLEDIKAKVYLFYGDADKNVPIVMGKYYASHIKGAKLIVYPNEGHLIQVTHREKIIKTLIKY